MATGSRSESRQGQPPKVRQTKILIEGKWRDSCPARLGTNPAPARRIAISPRR